MQRKRSAVVFCWLVPERPNPSGVSLTKCSRARPHKPLWQRRHVHQCCYRIRLPRAIAPCAGTAWDYRRLHGQSARAEAHFQDDAGGWENLGDTGDVRRSETMLEASGESLRAAGVRRPPSRVGVHKRSDRCVNTPRSGRSSNGLAGADALLYPQALIRLGCCAGDRISRRARPLVIEAHRLLKPPEERGWSGGSFGARAVLAPGVACPRIRVGEESEKSMLAAPQCWPPPRWALTFAELAATVDHSVLILMQEGSIRARRGGVVRRGGWGAKNAWGRTAVRNSGTSCCARPQGFNTPRGSFNGRGEQSARRGLRHLKGERGHHAEPSFAGF